MRRSRLSPISPTSAILTERTHRDKDKVRVRVRYSQLLPLLLMQFDALMTCSGLASHFHSAQHLLQLFARDLDTQNPVAIISAVDTRYVKV
jgi:hypothetical protein